MPLTGNRKADISEMMDKIKARGTFGTMGRGKSKKVLRKAALAAAYSAERRKKVKGRKKVRHHAKRGGR